jgi:LmbE family N-acetylglucosaminyl deacetylase
VRTLLAISPHLDDAVFSVGATIAQASRQGWRTIIATV